MLTHPQRKLTSIEGGRRRGVVHRASRVASCVPCASSFPAHMLQHLVRVRLSVRRVEVLELTPDVVTRDIRCAHNDENPLPCPDLARFARSAWIRVLSIFTCNVFSTRWIWQIEQGCVTGKKESSSSPAFYREIAKALAV